MPFRDFAERHALLARLCGQTDDEGPEPRTLFAFAHPDDETVGATFLVSRLRDSLVLYATDGAPRNGLDAASAGFRSSGAYARARRREAFRSLGRAGVPSSHIQFLDHVDQETAQNLVSLTRELQTAIRSFGPEAVVTHPYEGGHPDHDALAFAVHAACRLLDRAGAAVPVIIEPTFYHSRGGAFHFGEFLHPSETDVHVPLEDGQRDLKHHMVACHASQHHVLRSIAMDTESYRVAPEYDFLQPPHTGQLLYEFFCWDMSGSRWRRLARAALEELGLADGGTWTPRPACSFSTHR